MKLVYVAGPYRAWIAKGTLLMTDIMRWVPVKRAWDWDESWPLRCDECDKLIPIGDDALVNLKAHKAYCSLACADRGVAGDYYAACEVAAMIQERMEL